MINASVFFLNKTMWTKVIYMVAKKKNQHHFLMVLKFVNIIHLHFQSVYIGRRLFLNYMN